MKARRASATRKSVEVLFVERPPGLKIGRTWTANLDDLSDDSILAEVRPNIATDNILAVERDGRRLGYVTQTNGVYLAICVCRFIVEPTKLGPRGKFLKKQRLLDEVLWQERHREEYPGQFAEMRCRIEDMPLYNLMDLWCRGQNLIGFADSIIRAVDGLRTATKKGRGNGQSIQG